MRRFIPALFFGLAVWAQSVAPVRYIVQLEGEPAIAASDRSVRSAQIASQHATFERQVSALSGARVVATTRTALNSVIIEAAPGLQSRLAAMPGVKHVTLSRDLKLHLDHALHNHAIPPAWADSVTWEKAGLGIKIGILDTGITPGHPAFEDPNLPIADGFPQADTPANRALTTNKIIVARSFDTLDARDRYGHGTAVAAVAAGSLQSTLRGNIVGAAPKAWIGAYRVSRGSTGGIPTDFALQGIDAAAQDGMDIINMSFGSIGTVGSEFDPLAEAARTVAHRGIIVVVSAGNSGPEIMTVDDSAADPTVIAVGAAQNSGATTDARVITPVGEDVTALPSSNATTAPSTTGVLVDVAQVSGGDALACSALPANSLAGKVPLIQRGTCTFAEKLAIAATAGAQAALVYNNAEADDPEALIEMNVSVNPTIPGLFAAWSDGVRLRGELRDSATGYVVTLQFMPLPNNPNQLASFSSRGPSVDLQIKPDVLATGQNIYSPVPAGYGVVSGTSFSSPLVAGAIASLKTMRPGLHRTVYQSLIVNSATPVYEQKGAAAGTVMSVMKAGAGNLNLLSSLRSTLSVEPVSLAFGAQQSTVDASRQIVVRNISNEAHTYNLWIETSDTVKPTLTVTQLTLAPGEIAGPQLYWGTGGLLPGAYQGAILIQEPVSGIVSRVPYWMGVHSTTPASISIADRMDLGSVSVLYVRIHDAAGIFLPDAELEVVAGAGGGEVVELTPVGVGGLWEVVLGAGSGAAESEFTLKAGSAERKVTIY